MVNNYWEGGSSKVYVYSYLTIVPKTKKWILPSKHRHQSWKREEFLATVGWFPHISTQKPYAVDLDDPSDDFLNEVIVF